MNFFSHFLQILRSPLSGSGNAYVIAIIGAVAAGSYLLTGGLMPRIEQNPINPQHVEIDDTSIAANKDTLQLVNIQPKPSATPTPTVGGVTPGVTITSPITPPITPGVQACLEKSVITMMIDLSTSMGNDNKLAALNTALDQFVASLPPKTIVGGIAFGGPSSDFTTDGLPGVKLLSKYTSNKTNVKNRFTSLDTGTGAGTYIRNAFQVAVNRLDTFQKANATRNYHYITIFFSDGLPEMVSTPDPTCLHNWGYLDGPCWAREQDPRSRNYGMTDTDLVDAMDVLLAGEGKAYSVAIYNSAPGSWGVGWNNDLIKLLQTIASGSRAPYYQAIDLNNTSVNGIELTDFFKSITDDACS